VGRCKGKFALALTFFKNDRGETGEGGGVDLGSDEEVRLSKKRAAQRRPVGGSCLTGPVRLNSYTKRGRHLEPIPSIDKIKQAGIKAVGVVSSTKGRK